MMPGGIVRVAESGITGTDDALVLAAAGFHAVLVGESVVTSGDRSGSVTRLRVRRR
jgi:indole-3-glycerol phosphate synthase